ncbi:unnamed protein product [Kuraishia capsulata CBS 1993]|uniref:Uncharacterized protein n=1 Tax=Kuraishia capsulata CBS 1993 TaxID=1382522 RepID=W6MQE7_9ASCO|nr:uncharacterized protein KUCA_T00000075001 [Kuraishia capsulata CBS 1993]CDK24115.1 unnamed protein product [Kuraishia capsulata CBS 1993]
MSLLPLLKKRDDSQLSSKEKRYSQNVERALVTFESVVEWADYISYLSKLLKALQTNPAPQENHWIPQQFTVSKSLSKCLSPKLPSGVHRKALEVYELIFETLGIQALGANISVWLPGLLPLMSFASITVKPWLIKLFQDFIVKINPEELHVIMKSVLLSLLPGLDDTTSESFSSTMSLIEGFKTNLNDDTHFWQCLFLCIITSPDRRQGALEWCIKKLPSFIPETSADEQTQTEDDIEAEDGSVEKETPESLHSLSPTGVLSLLQLETRSCVLPSTKLMMMAFCKGLGDENVLVQRGFFDLLVTKIELKSPILQILTSTSDQKTLVMSATKTVLRKDMSLNRRLWNWLLGPETEKLEAEGSSLTRSEYFKAYGLTTLSESLLDMINGANSSETPHQQRIEAYRISVALMDRWEIGQLIIPKILTPILQSAKTSVDLSSGPMTDEVLRNAGAFFDGVESINIWSDLLKLSKDREFDILLFVLKNFNVEEEDMVIAHIPMILLMTFLQNEESGDIRWIVYSKALLSVIPQRAFLPIEHAAPEFLEPLDVDSKTKVMSKIEDYYSTAEVFEDRSKPFTGADMGALLLNTVSSLVSSRFQDASLIKGDSTFALCEILSELLGKVPMGEKMYRNDTLIKSALDLENAGFDVPITFGLAVIFNPLVKSCTYTEKTRLLKVLTNFLWLALVDKSCKYPVETVRCIWNMEMSVESHYIEGALSSLFTKDDQPYEVKMRAFSALWTHTATYHGTNQILMRPTFLLLDDLSSEDETKYIQVSDWIINCLGDGSISRIYKMLGTKLLSFPFLVSGSLSRDDDLTRFSYQLETVANLLNVSAGPLTQSIAKELCVLESSVEMKVIDANNWNISTYKSLLIIVVMKFLSLSPPQNSADEFWEPYARCVKLSLKLLGILLNGTEPEFYSIMIQTVEFCSTLNADTSIKDLVEVSYVDAIGSLLQTAASRGSTQPLVAPNATEGSPGFDVYLDFLLLGISNSKSAIVVDAWMRLLSVSLKLHKSVVFSILPEVTGCICSKIEDLFLRFKETCSTTIVTNGEELLDGNLYESFSFLMGGLQQLLIISYDYMKEIDSSSSAGVGSRLTGESGFFGTVMQGVFQVEAPSHRDAVLTRKLTVLNAFKSATVMSYRIWLWADQNSKVTGLQPVNSGSTLNVFKQVSRMGSFTGHYKLPSSSKETTDGFLKFDKSLSYTAGKLKFRTKKLLEMLYRLETLESLETLIEAQNNQFCSLGTPYTIFKIIHVLDGGRPQNTLPHLFNSLITRVNPTAIDVGSRSSLNNDLTERMISAFIVQYAESLGNDTIEDIWPQVTQFLKDVQSNSAIFKHLYPDLLRFVCILGLKLGQTRFGEQKRVRRELTEYFTKMLGVAVYSRFQSDGLSSLLTNPLSFPLSASEEAKTPTPVETGMTAASKLIEGQANSGSQVSLPEGANKQQISQEELCNALFEIIPKIQVLVQDNDKVINSLNSIVAGVAIPVLKGKAVGSIPNYAIALLTVISDASAVNIKGWKSLLYDVLMDTKFFTMSITESAPWNSIMFTWIDGDKERMSDLISRMQPYSGNSTLFGWNDSELTTRGLHLKRVAYLLMVSPVDRYLINVKDIVNRLSDILAGTGGILKPDAFLCLRALILRFTEPHLTTAWPMIYSELQQVFQTVLAKIENLAEGETPNSETDLDILLMASKLLDVLLLLKFEDFQLNEWLFVSETPKDSEKVPTLAIIDRISEIQGVETRTASTENDEPLGKKKPLLLGLKHVKQMTQLQSFFSKLSSFNYESAYSLRVADTEACEHDIFNDLFQ